MIIIPRIRKIQVMDNYKLAVTFDDDVKVIYDVLDDINTLPEFKALLSIRFFKSVKLDSSRTCVYWNDRIDIPSDTIREYGTICGKETTNM